ncbi:ArsR/SmtB family transcription factor [Nocardiopsis changdeensis]|uniref:Winged helix-turn-helix transcriptional regulator n=1 Tax=Nocardiopsis changdeensis TaxID=2831969 RepID=A0ABX8BFX0_9ACTN|nr:MULTISPECIES: winged helix-turn-helix domain-containing protein [Nocardiopsis]QUX20178.1 winged helix-turn-helix transcriptional regulator [Nocardiopsis changdeensis]QYX36106.1 winged helix-turn-helix domain-containing protein [Nocardiopsis sp. MT53]
MADAEQYAPEPAAPVRERRPATPEETKALGHPLRVRILRLCLDEMTNKELAERLGVSPGTVLYHVRRLVDVGFLVPGIPRTGPSGALEKPYRATGETWWLDSPLQDAGPAAAHAPVQAFRRELDEAGPGAVRTFSRFTLHLSDEDIAELDRRIVAVLDEFVATDGERRDSPRYSGMFLLHRPAGAGGPDPDTERGAGARGTDAP